MRRRRHGVICTGRDLRTVLLEKRRRDATVDERLMPRDALAEVDVCGEPDDLEFPERLPETRKSLWSCRGVDDDLGSSTAWAWNGLLTKVTGPCEILDEVWGRRPRYSKDPKGPDIGHE